MPIQRRFLNLPALICVALLLGFSMSDARAADLTCNKCVDTSDIAKKAISASRIKAGAVKSGKIAADAVTSSKIKDGTVGLADINPDVIVDLQGDPGPEGPQGPAGPAGADGADGQSVTSTPLSSGDLNCPDGGSQFDAVSGMTFACNGAQGPEGTAGQAGADGDGTFISVFAQPVGADGTHPLGQTLYEVVDVCGASGEPLEAGVLDNPNTPGRISAGVFNFQPLRARPRSS